MNGFKYEIERPWKFKGSPELQKLTFNGDEISVENLINVAEKMRLELLGYGVVMKVILTDKVGHSKDGKPCESLKL